MSSSVLIPRRIGQTVELETSAGSSMLGTLFCNDASTNCVVLQQDAGSTMRIVAVPCVTRALAHAPTFATEYDEKALPPLPTLNADKIHEREQKALNRIKRETAKIGHGVTPQAQSIFNALVKTLPCRWVETSIVIFEDRFEVRLVSPYAVENVSGNDAPSVARVKKVLMGELAKLAI